MRITVGDYLRGYDTIYPRECTAEIMTNAAKTVAAVNSLLAVLEAEQVPLETNRLNSIINSGWRPPQVNGQITNAAPRSKHMTAQACDLYDPEGLIDDYLASEAGQRVLVAQRLFMEHPSATKGWCHVQTEAPRSGRRIFYP